MKNQTSNMNEAKSSLDSTTRLLLLCGAIAGPLYVVLGIFQMLIRPGFDPTRHDLSLMSNGELGWIQISNFIVTGLLTIAGAVGMRRALQSGRGRTWGPLLIGLYGLGLIGAGIFVADPINGFPPGAATGTPVITSNGILHLVTGAIGFLGLIAACFVFARRFRSLNQPGWANFSIATGVIFFAAFFGIAMGTQQGGAILTFVTLAFTFAVILGWSWISLLSVKLMKG